jgi:hypothetical protein
MHSVRNVCYEDCSSCSTVMTIEISLCTVLTRSVLISCFENQSFLGRILRNNAVLLLFCYLGICLDRNAIPWRALVNTMMKLTFHKKEGNFFASWATVRFSVRTLLSEVNYLVTVIAQSEDTGSVLLIDIIYCSLPQLSQSVINPLKFKGYYMYQYL